MKCTCKSIFRCSLAVAFGALASSVGNAQQNSLPAAPAARLIAQAGQVPAQSSRQTGETASADTRPALTLQQAEQMAQQQNPTISVAHLAALIQDQQTRAVRSGELPTATAALTAVDAHDNTRITAGLLNNPSVYNRAAAGISVSQLLTDFGRTHHLVQSAEAEAAAQRENERATREEIALAVDQAFFQALSARAVLRVAQQTVQERQTTVDEVGALTNAKLRSALDLSLANVQLAQAKLLLLDAQNSIAASYAALNAILGTEADIRFHLVDPVAESPEPAPLDAEAMVRAAFQARPDLAAVQQQAKSAKQFSAAERDLWMPTVSALATAGATPVRADQIQSSWYGAAGANVSIPVFNGFLFSARAGAASLEAHAAEERVRALRDTIARDVRTAVLNAQNAFQRISVTREMLNQADQSLDLAQTRYKLGLSGIVELSQAQLAQTEAEIAYANARYSYQGAQSVLRFQTGQ